MNQKNIIIYLFIFFLILILISIKLEYFSIDNYIQPSNYEFNDKVCIYTCVTGNYDNKVYFGKNNVNCDLLFFTNNKELGLKFKNKGWTVNYIDDDDVKDNKLLARKHKILTHKYIPKKYEISLWIDGNISLKNNFFDINKFLKEIEINKYDLVCKEHPFNNNLKSEKNTILALKYEKEENINKILEIQKNNNFKDDIRLTETNILIRKNNNNINKAMEEWFNLVKICIRDQMSFDYILWKNNILYNRLKYNFYHDQYFMRKKHHNDKSKIVEFFNNFINIF